MAKQTLPGIPSGGGTLRKVVGAGVLLALLTMIVKHPTESAASAQAALNWLGGTVESVSTFLRGLT